MSQFDVLPDERTVAVTVAALESHGFTVEVVDDLTAARNAVLARIPHGSRVWRNTSVTLDEAGISTEIDAAGGPYESVRLQMTAEDGELLIGSTSGSQFATLAWGANHVVLVAGLHKVVADLETARQTQRYEQ